MTEMEQNKTNVSFAKRITASPEVKKGFTVFLGVVTAIVIGMLMLASQGYSPMESYASILKYSLSTSVGISNTINRAVFLLIAGASASIALGSGASNLGQFGQLLMGAMAATLIGLYVPLPSWLLIPLMIIGGMAAGALYAGLAALGRQRFGMNEFIITLMLNFIADYFTRYLITNPLKDPGASWPASPVVPGGAILPAMGKIDCAAFIMIAVYIIAVFYMKKSRTGYEMRIMGKNGLFARVGGCKTDKNFMKVMLSSGALAGLVGVMMIMGASQQHRFLGGLGQGYADDGLMISIVSGNQVTGVFIYAIIFSIFQSGSTGMQLDTGVPSEFTKMLIAITVLSVVTFRSYSGIFLDKLAAFKKTRSLHKGVNQSESVR